MRHGTLHFHPANAFAVMGGAAMKPSPVKGGAVEARAFTLIEILLAVTIFAIVLVAIHTVFYAAIHLRNKTTEAFDRAVPFERAVAIMKRDLANMVMPGGTFFGELQTAQTSTTLSNALSSLNPVNDTLPGQSGPAFYTSAGILQDGLPWGNVERVSYYLASPTNNTPGKDLIRSVTRNLLPVLAEQPETESLMSGLQSLTFLFWDGIQWRQYWDSTIETNKLPYGIKVQLQLVAEENGPLHPAPIEVVVPIILQPGTNQATQATGGGA